MGEGEGEVVGGGVLGDILVMGKGWLGPLGHTGHRKRVVGP